MIRASELPFRCNIGLQIYLHDIQQHDYYIIINICIIFDFLFQIYIPYVYDTFNIHNTSHMVTTTLKAMRRISMWWWHFVTWQALFIK